MSNPTRWNVAIAGFGTVGKAVAELLLARRERYRQVHAADVRLIAACGSRRGLLNPEGLEADHLRVGEMQDGLTGNAFLAAAPVDILIEAGPTDFRTGGPGLVYMSDALARGRHVIAVSKGALVIDGKNLRDLAIRSGAFLKVSGATAAALPTIDLLDFNLLGCGVTRIEGILNGTSNYLLTAMSEDNIDFAEALRQARQAGITEADPSFDVEGWDTACKLLIIANLGLGAALSLADLTVGGITNVSRGQLTAWRKNGQTPKLVGYLVRSAAGWRGGVEIRTYGSDDQLSLVRGKNKAIRIDTDEMGEIFVSGGASNPRATAAAALKDLEHILAAGAPARTKTENR